MNEAAKERRLGAARAALAQAMQAREGAGMRALESGQGEKVQGEQVARQGHPEASGNGEGNAATFDPGDAQARRRLFVRMTLISDYRLSSAFIPVPKLALILGVSPSTIWSHMRQRKFPIPYRMFNTTPMVCIDDLVDWYCDKDDLIVPDEAQELRAQAKPDVDEERRRLSEETDDIVASALASLGISPRRRRSR